MNYETARDKLLNHGNLTYGLAHAPDEESILFVLWNADESKTAPNNLIALANDIIDCLEVVNKKWNGAIPSETSDSAKKLERYLVCAVSGIIHSCWEYFREWQESKLFDSTILNQLSLTAWQVSYAWNAVLAGDIDEIAKEVEYGKMARNIESQ